MAVQNITDIPAPRVAFIDARTGLMAREWYRFFLNLFTLTGGGQSDITINDLAVSPTIGDTAELLQGTTQAAQLSAYLAQFDLANQLIQGAYVEPEFAPVSVFFDPASFAIPAQYQETQRAFSSWGTAKTIVSGFGTTPAITASNGTAAFAIDIGTGGTADAGVIGLPAAPNGWVLSVENLTATAANRGDERTVQTATTTTSATVENQTISTGAALAWTASDVLLIAAFAY